MIKTNMKYILSLAVGIAIGWYASNVSTELEGIESALLEGQDRINVLGFFESGEDTDRNCFEVMQVLPSLHEAKSVISANQILHWIKPNIKENAKKTEQVMQKYLNSTTKEVCKGAPYFVKETLVELGYDL